MKLKKLNTSVGALIKKKRIESGLDQETFAGIMDLSRVSVVNIEKGRQSVTLESLYKVAYSLDCPVSEFLPPVNDVIAGVTITAEFEKEINKFFGDDAEDAKKLIIRIKNNKKS